MTLTLISAFDDLPVANATVKVGSQTGTTGTDGTVILQNVSTGMQFSAEAAGFVGPSQSRLSATPWSLIPDNTEFMDWAFGDGWNYLIRWEGPPRQVGFYIPDSIRGLRAQTSDGQMLDAPAIYQRAINRFNAAQTQLTLSLTDNPSAEFRATLNDTGVNNAFAHIDHTQSGGITGCTLEFRSTTLASNEWVIGHEIGHCFGGTGHMKVGPGLTRSPVQGTDYSPNEKANMRMLLKRSSGTLKPDTAASLGSSLRALSSGRTTRKSVADSF